MIAFFGMRRQPDRERQLRYLYRLAAGTRDAQRAVMVRDPASRAVGTSSRWQRAWSAMMREGRTLDPNGILNPGKELYFTDPDNIRIQLQDVSYCGGSGRLGQIWSPKTATPLSHDLRASTALAIAHGAPASRNWSDARDRAPASRDPDRNLK
jgi:hypothetical protein